MGPTEHADSQPDGLDAPEARGPASDDAQEDAARIVYDSRLDPDLSSATRSSTVTRMLVLRSGDLSVELECFGSTVVGQVVPPSDAVVELVGRGRPGVQATETDAAGGFLFQRRVGPFRLTARTRGGRALRTDWLPVTG